MTFDLPSLTTQLLSQIQEHLLPGQSVNLLPGFSVFTSTASTCPIQALYKPMCCLVLQGAKEIMIGEQTLRYGAGDYFVGSVDLPVATRILEASAEQPYIAMTMQLDLDRVALLTAEFPRHQQESMSGSSGRDQGYGVAQARPELLDGWRRLLDLIKEADSRPHDIQALAP